MFQDESVKFHTYKFTNKETITKFLDTLFCATRRMEKISKKNIKEDV